MEERRWKVRYRTWLDGDGIYWTRAIVLLFNGGMFFDVRWGLARKSPNDRLNKKLGRRIALGRAVKMRHPGKYCGVHRFSLNGFYGVDGFTPEENAWVSREIKVSEKRLLFYAQSGA